jgi:NADH dehydrogenase
MRVLVLGGAGFLGRHVVAALAARGHDVAIGSRDRRRVARIATLLNMHAQFRQVRFERLTAAGCWDPALDGIDVVVNCVGILRERGAATYERIHHLAPAALARDCARLHVRLIHVSALGLHNAARSGFIGSKLRGEQAIKDSGARFTIVRPSLLDGEGGYGARWLRALARLPVHCVPVDAVGRIAVLDAGDAGRAIARLCEIGGDAGYREVELGGPDWYTLDEHLAALRARLGRSAARVVRIPALLARLASHACDLMHLSPFSFGHLELLRRDNVPAVNVLPLLVNAPPRPAGARVTPIGTPIMVGRGTASARGRATLRPIAIRDGENRSTARAR